MKKILITGGTGFVGQNIVPNLAKVYEVIAPKRHELNLMDEHEVWNYLKQEAFDIIIHGAGPVRNKVDSKTKVLEESMRLFMNFYRGRDLYGKMIYLGSGAEYDKERGLNLVKEEEIGVSIPKDEYGFAKYIMNTLTRTSDNLYNLRLFACFGPYEHESRLISDAISCALNKVPIRIKQDCYFDYMYVEDLLGIIKWFIEHTPKFHDYNVCSALPRRLSEIVSYVDKQIGGNGIGCEIRELGKAYTGDNGRLKGEIRHFSLTSLEEGIDKQIAWQRGE